MKLYYKFSVVDDYLIIEFNGKKVDVFPKEEVFLDADRLLKFKEVHVRYFSDEVVKFTKPFDECALTEDTPVSVEDFLNYFTSERVGLTAGSAAPTDYTQVLSDISESVDVIEASISGKKQDLLSWVPNAVGDTLTIAEGSFTTLSLSASKGEFKIENSFNDFSADFTSSAGVLNTFIEISEDGVGTTTGSVSVPQGFDTRANTTDMDPANNSFLITAVRQGVLQIEVYKK